MCMGSANLAEEFCDAMTHLPRLKSRSAKVRRNILGKKRRDVVDSVKGRHHFAELIGQAQHFQTAQRPFLQRSQQSRDRPTARCDVAARDRNARVQPRQEPVAKPVVCERRAPLLPRCYRDIGG
jgi:hypothetical protein